MAEKTFAMIKPHVVKSKNVGKIIDMIEQNGFTILRMEKKKLTSDIAKQFYNVHREKPFFEELVKNITNGSVILLALERDNAISEWRKLMGETDSKKAAPGTIRQQFGIDISFNAVHGSDSQETAQQELKLMFPDLQQ